MMQKDKKLSKNVVKLLMVLCADILHSLLPPVYPIKNHILKFVQSLFLVPSFLYRMLINFSYGMLCNTAYFFIL